MKRKLLQTIGATVLIMCLLASSVLATVNMELILDASSSMGEKIQGKTKMEIAKEILLSFLTELPKDTNVGLRIYGMKGIKPDSSELVVPIEPLNKDKAALISALLAAEPAGLTPIAYSLEQALNDFQGLKGENVIVLVSDGQETCGGDPIAVAKKLAESKIKVKTYVIGFVINEIERIQLEKIAQAGRGKYYEAKNATELAQSFKEVKREVVVEKPKETILAQVKLKNGSLIIANVLDRKLSVETKYGKMIIDVKGIRSIVGENIELKDGSILKGKIAKKSLRIKPVWYEPLNIEIRYIDSVFFPAFKTSLLPQWKYRRPFKISGSTSNLTDYQVQLIIDTASLISEGKMQLDCDDIRFTNADGNKILAYWIESGCNSASTKIWVKVPSIPTAGTTIYMYYGNSWAISESDGEATFEFFDDFEDGEWTDDWNSISIVGSNTISVQSGKLVFHNTYSTGYTSARTLESKADINLTNFALEARFNYPTIQEYDIVFNAYLWNPDYSIEGYWRYKTNPPSHTGLYVTGNDSYVAETPSANVWYTGILTRYGLSTKYRVKDANSIQGTYTAGSAALTKLRLYFYLSYQDREIWCDDIRLRKYASPEPVATVGSEEKEGI